MFTIPASLICSLVSILKLCFFNFTSSENHIRYANEPRLGFKPSTLRKDGCTFMKKLHEKGLYFNLICFADVTKLLQKKNGSDVFRTYDIYHYTNTCMQTTLMVFSCLSWVVSFFFLFKELGCFFVSISYCNKLLATLKKFKNCMNFTFYQNNKTHACR